MTGSYESLQTIVGQDTYNVWKKMLLELVPDGRTHRLAPMAAGMLQYAAAIAYERYGDSPEEGSAADIMSLSPTETEQILELSDTLEALGFSISSFGGKEISVSQVPEIFGRVTTEIELISLLDQITSIGVSEAQDAFMDELVKLTACHSAIRAGQTLSIEEIRSLIEDFSKTQGRYTCCHGRPTMIRITKNNLDKAVGRLGHDAIQRFKKRHRIE